MQVSQVEIMLHSNTLVFL